MRRLAAITSQIAAWVFLILAILAVWSLYEENRERYAAYQENSQATQDKSASDIAGKCHIVFPPFNSLRECLATEIDAYIEDRDTNQDLKAQVDMAYWASALFWLSVFTAIISIFGLAFVYQSLHQTRTIIKDTREIGEAQTRAYIGIENLEERPFRVSSIEVGKPIEVSFCYVNKGTSPANRVAYTAICEINTHPFDFKGTNIIMPNPNELIAPNTIQSGEKAYGEATTDFILTKDNIKEIMGSGGDKRLYLICRIEYDDVFKNKQWTNGCFYLEFSPLTVRNGRKVRNGQWYLAKSHNNAS